MMRKNKKPVQIDLILFFLITFLWSWSLNILRLFSVFNRVVLPDWLFSGLGYIAVFGPSVAAFSLTGLRFGSEGLKALWQRGWKMQGSKIWLLVAVLIVPFGGLLTSTLMALLGLPGGWEFGLSPAMIVPVGLLIWLLGALPEEFGWRGFALERLQKFMNPLFSSLVLGAIWSLWHLPLHFIPTTTQYHIPFWEYAAQTIVLSVLYTWLYNHTGGSVLIAGLFHASGNLAGALLPTWTTQVGRWLGLVPLFILALLLVLFRKLGNEANIHTEQENSANF